MVNQFVRTDYYQHSILDKASSSATPIVNRTKWGNLLFPLPLLDQQGRIIQKIEELFTWCDILQWALSRTQQTNQRLLKALIKLAI